MSIYTWKEDENIQCPNCKTDLSNTEKFIFCSKCGMLFDKHWIIETARILGYEMAKEQVKQAHIDHNIEYGEANV